MNPKLFPLLLMVLDLGASIVWFSHGDLRRGFYWLMAAGLTLCVTLGSVSMIATNNNDYGGTSDSNWTPTEEYYVGNASGIFDADDLRRKQRQRELDWIDGFRRVLPVDASRPIVADSQRQGLTADAASAIALKRGLK